MRRGEECAARGREPPSPERPITEFFRKEMKMRKRLLSLVLAFVMVLSLVPVTALAAKATDTVTAYVTISNQGILAAAKDGTAMACKEVSVTDLDADGKLTVSDALLAAHTAYSTNGASDYAISAGYASKLWGVDSGNLLAFVNDEGLSSAWNAAEIKSGDYIVASINKDGITYADWYAFFDTTTKEATVGETFTLTLKGHLGMAYTDEDMADTALSGLSVDTWTKNGFSAISGKTTDADGKVTLSFDTAGIYYVTASGTVKDTVTTDWSTGTTAEVDCPIIAPVCVVTVSEGQSSDTMSDKEAISSIYAKFSSYDSNKNGLVVPCEYNGVTYTNVVSYIKAWAKAETGRDATVNYTPYVYTSSYSDWSSGSKMTVKYTPMDSESNIIQGYFTNNANNTMQRLDKVSFTVGTQTSSEISQLWLSVASLQATPKEIVANVKANLPFARIANGNVDQDYVVKALGEVSGSTTALPTANTGMQYTSTSATVAWSLTNVSGKSDAMKLASNKITVSRPNVGEENAVFDLTATITAKMDTSVSDTVTYRLTVPAFEGVTVPIQVTEGATLSLIDNYYGSKAAVDGKYITKQENAPEGYDLYNCTLHTNATGGSQSFKYTVTKDGYITKAGTISVTGSGMDTTVIDLTASSENDTRLATLESLAPAMTIDLDPNKAEYEIEVSGVQYVKLAGTVAADGASATITSYYKSLANANKGTLATTGGALSEKGTFCYLPDAAGTYEIKITVTAPTGSTQTEKTRVYTITVKKTAASSPLTGLTLTASSTEKGTNNSIGSGNPVPAEETLSPTFVAGGHEDLYTYNVNYWRDQITVKPTAANCTITVQNTTTGAAVATVTSGSTTVAIPLNVGDNIIEVKVTKGEETTTYKINVHRKAELYITNVTLDNGELATTLATDGSGWTGSCNFAHNAETVHVTYHTNLSQTEEAKVTVKVVDGSKTYEGTAGQSIEIPVGTRDSVKPTVWLVYNKDENTVEGQKYVISLYRKPADAPSAVASYLPAPGQFVNTTSWQEAGKTLNGSAGITLGAFGGNVVYYYEEPITNDPNNPYGIDFIVIGNAFTNSDGSTSSGAAEPGAVMVSQDGETWYELAGSEYYDAATTHDLTITYTNGDTTFSAAADTPWVDSEGNSGVMPKNEYHNQAYYPDLSYYMNWQTGVGKNGTYTKETVSFTGSKLNEPGFYPFGYADTHAAGNYDSVLARPTGNQAANPYAANHNYQYNGDGFDLSWAVDANGDPVELESISYIKIYNPVLSYGSSRGEYSPEIQSVLRAKANTDAVGESSGLTALNVNGKAVTLTEGTYAYTIDAEGASSLKITPTASNADANIYVSNQRVTSGSTTAAMTATDKTRIIVQEGEKEPVIYTLTFTNVATKESNADLTALTLTPGDTVYTPDENNQITISVPNTISAIRLMPQAGYVRASLSLTGGKLSQAVVLTSGTVSEALALDVGENTFALTVTSKNGENTKTYPVKVTRAAATSTTPSGMIRVTFSMTGDTLHYDADTKTYTGSHTASTWISTTKITVPENSTVKYVTEMMLNNEGIDYVTDGIYVSEINGLGEFDNGPNSGWMYRHNGKIADEGYADRTLKDGDTVKWFYTDDYTKETGYEGGWDHVNSSNADQKAADSVIKLIDAIGTVTETSGDKITAARKAYDALTTAQQKLVTNYQLLAKAEAAFADLTGDLLFGDVKTTDYFYNAVQWAVKQKITNGMSATTFGPEESCTRAQMVTFLWRAAGSPEPTGSTVDFSDVDQNAYYFKALLWAMEQGITTGITETTFGPEEPCTRGQMAAFLYRNAQSPAVEGTHPFTDVKETDYYQDAVLWAAEQGITQGMTATTFGPADDCTRGQMVTFLYRSLAG